VVIYLELFILTSNHLFIHLLAMTTSGCIALRV